MISAADLFDFPESLPFAGVFRPELPPWQWVTLIKDALAGLDFDAAGGRTDFPPGLQVEGPVHIDPGVKLPAYGSITGPCYIGAGCELRPGVFIRGNVIAGTGCVLGNSSEFKNCLLLDRVEAPHFNYVGDTVAGNRAHLAAGVICSNLRLDQASVPVRLADGTRVDSGLRKLGALIGDAAEIGCNAVLNPGTVLGRRSLVMPALAYGGYLAADSIVVSKPDLTILPRPDSGSLS